MCAAIVAGTRRGETYRLLLESFDDGEGSGVVNVLHNEPVDGLLVLAVYTRRLDQLELDALDGIRVVLGVEVNGERVDHRGGGWAVGRLNSNPRYLYK